MSDIGICEYCKYKDKDMAQNPCYNCSAQMGAFEFDMSEHDEQIKAEVIDKFNNVLKEKHFTLCSIQDEEGYQYPSYIELNDIYRNINEVAEMLKEQK